MGAEVLQLTPAENVLPKQTPMLMVAVIPAAEPLTAERVKETWPDLAMLVVFQTVVGV